MRSSCSPKAPAKRWAVSSKISARGPGTPLTSVADERCSQRGDGRSTLTTDDSCLSTLPTSVPFSKRALKCEHSKRTWLYVLNALNPANPKAVPCSPKGFLFPNLTSRTDHGRHTRCVVVTRPNSTRTTPVWRGPHGHLSRRQSHSPGASPVSRMWTQFAVAKTCDVKTNSCAPIGRLGRWVEAGPPK